MSLQQDIDNLVDAICNTYYSGGPMHIVLLVVLKNLCSFYILEKS